MSEQDLEPRLNELYFIVVSKGMGTLGNGDETLRLINDPILLLEGEVPFKQTLYATLSFSINVEGEEKFTIKVVSPENKTIAIINLGAYIDDAKKQAPQREEGELISLVGIVGAKLGEKITFKVKGQYKFYVCLDDVILGSTSIFVDDGYEYDE